MMAAPRGGSRRFAAAALLAAGALCRGVDGQNPFSAPECVGPDCCRPQEDEFSRQLACSMLAYFDLDPNFSWEGCKKNSKSCRAVCESRAYDLIIAEYSKCDRDFNKDVAIGDWYACFFEAVLSSVVFAVAYQNMETEPVIDITGVYCQLISQPGCPLCIALRLDQSPCDWSGIANTCPHLCQTCKCPAPVPDDFQAAGFVGCPASDGAEDAAEWGSTCGVACPANTTSPAGQLRCESGRWVGAGGGDALCRADCDASDLALPPGGASLELAAGEGGGGPCGQMEHGQLCKLSCEAGLTPSADWRCDDGVLLPSLVTGGAPSCLADCAAPPLPAGAELFMPCSNPMAEVDAPTLDGSNTTCGSDGRVSVAVDGSRFVSVPLETASGSACELVCRHPLSPTGPYRCRNGEWTVPACTLQLLQTGLRWPAQGREIVSPLGSVHLEFNLDVLAAEAAGEAEVTICGRNELGCPRATDCFAIVPVRDTGRVTASSRELRVRLGHGVEADQTFGCEYEVKVPAGAALAVLNRSAASEEFVWVYSLVPPPPRLLSLVAAPSYSHVDAEVLYDTPGTLSCLTAAPGEIPDEAAFDSGARFSVQSAVGSPAFVRISDLAELADYDLFCRLTSVQGLLQSMVSVHDNVHRFRTLTRIPYLRNITLVELGHHAVTLSLRFSTQCSVRCAAQQHASGNFNQDDLKEAVNATPAVDFEASFQELKVDSLEPGVPTVVACIAFKQESERSIFYQPWEDSWSNRIQVETPPMTITSLGQLTAVGCELVPPFSEGVPLYACALPDGAGADSPTVTLAAAVPQDAYSEMDCGDGTWASSCSAQLSVDEGAVASWQVRVRAQSGIEAPYIVTAMREPPVEPREIRPSRFPATGQAPNMTVCAHAEPHHVPLDKAQVRVLLLPGPWELAIHDLHVGDDLPSCSCAGCNLEVLAGVAGAGANLTLVLFISDFPGFDLDPALRVSFEPPLVGDVDPPVASMYQSTELVVRGSNFGHDAGVGATIRVDKVGPPIVVPPGHWYGDCPILHINVKVKGFGWAKVEFNGRYEFKERGRYDMLRETSVRISAAEVAMLPEELREAGPEGPEQPVALSDNLRERLIKRMGQCCYTELSALRLLNSAEGGYILEVRRDGRRWPRLTKQNTTWILDSRGIRDLRLQSLEDKLGRYDPWTFKHPDDIEYPDPLEDAGGFWRRLSPAAEASRGTKGAAEASPETRADFTVRLAELHDSLVGRAGMVAQMLPSEEGMQSRQVTAGAGRRLCEDNSAKMREVLETMQIDLPPGLGWLVTCGTVTSLMGELCTFLKLICECSCEDYFKSPSEAAATVDALCERCGDGLRVGAEECDDGNLLDDDGCNSQCRAEAGWTCDDAGCEPNPETELLDRNLCGPTVWVDEATLRCELAAGTRTPLALTVEVGGQSSRPGSWVQYAQPSVTAIVLASAAAASSKEAPLEFVGGQGFVLTGRGLPPSAELAKQLGVSVLLGSPGARRLAADGDGGAVGDRRLCADLEVLSTSELRCFATQSLSLDDLPEDPQVFVRVGEVTSPGVPLSALRLSLRRPELLGVEPKSFNDTDEKMLRLAVEHAGLPEHGTLRIDVGGAACRVLVHTETLVVCSIGYVPVGRWQVSLQLGGSTAKRRLPVDSAPTRCPVGKRRVFLETSDCDPCPSGKADPEVNADFGCPNCTDGLYQNDTGQAECKFCTFYAFSVGNRTSKEHCRCQAGFYHMYGSPALAEACSRCEVSRGFGWATSNWTLDCEDCASAYADPPESLLDFGLCPSECFGLACSPCPFGTVCFGNAAWPRVLPGFFAENIFERDAVGAERCMPMKACLGEDGSGNMLCAQGYGGTRCAVCLLGYFKEQHECLPCPDNQWVWGFLFFVVFLLLVVLVAIPAQMVFMCRLMGISRPLPLVWRLACTLPQSCARLCRTCRTPRRKPNNGAGGGPAAATRLGGWCDSGIAQPAAARARRWLRGLRAAPLLRTLSMCLNYGQTCYAFSMLQRPAVAWPGPSWELLSWTKLLTVDVEFMKPDCIVPLPYFTKWIGKFCFPFGMIALIFLVTLYLSWSLRRAEVRSPAESALPGIWNAFCFTLALAVHMSLIWHLKVVLSPVDCNWCREGVKCLDEYTLVECWTDDPTWRKMMVISTLDFVFVSGAFPLFLVCAVHHSWLREAAPEKSSSIVSQAPSSTSMLRSFTNFFVNGYRGRGDGGNLVTFGWEAVVLFRKLALLLAAKFTTVHPVRGANLQLLILLVSLLGQLTLRPYHDAILNDIDGVLNTLEFVTLLSACQLTMGVGEELGRAYIFLNVATLFGGALLAAGISIAKLWMTWEAEAGRAGSGPKPVTEATPQTCDASALVFTAAGNAAEGSEARELGEASPAMSLPGAMDDALGGEGGPGPAAVQAAAPSTMPDGALAISVARDEPAAAIHAHGAAAAACNDLRVEEASGTASSDEAAIAVAAAAPADGGVGAGTGVGAGRKPED